MPNGYFSTPMLFLIETLFGLYIGIVALRLIMQWSEWDYHNPLAQMIIKLTQPPVKFLRQVIPAIGRVDTATIVLMVLLSLIKFGLIMLIQSIPVTVLILVRLVMADIFSLFITLFTASIVIEVILSWIMPLSNSYNPITPLIHKMNRPLLNPVRQRIPAMGGLDLSPLLVILGLQIIAMLVLPILTGHY